jgi:hypothetical protein
MSASLLPIGNNHPQLHGYAQEHVRPEFSPRRAGCRLNGFSADVTMFAFQRGVNDEKRRVYLAVTRGYGTEVYGARKKPKLHSEKDLQCFEAD